MKPLKLMIPLALVMLLFSSLDAVAWIRSPATTFATLPAGAANPEGITVDDAGNVYVTTFNPGGSGHGHMYVFSPSGQLLRDVTVAGSSPALLDLAFHPNTGDLLVIDFGAHQVLRVNPFTGASSVFTTLPAGAGPNVLTFDGAGNVYISDSFGGIIWRAPQGGGASVAWVTNSLLLPNGVPPFGANGLVFNRAETALFVANTANDTVVKIPVTGGTPGTPVVFAYSINGADGLIRDDDDNLWVAANQADEIVVINPDGRVIAKLGDFEGIGPNGAARGLLFPSSLVRSGNFIYVVNLALDLRGFGFNAVDSQWAAEVTTHTVAKIPARIPPIQGLK